MRIFDPHIHMTSRTTDDYEAMHAAGVRAVVEPAFWLGRPRTSPESFYDYFDALLGWEPYRAAQFGIQHFCTIALNPKEANDPRCTPVLDELDRYLAKDRVVAVGERGSRARLDTVLPRALRRAGLLEVHTQDGMEYLDPWTSRAFAVADHQIAHVYVKDPADTATVAKTLHELDGVERVLDADGKAAHGLDHERSGELVAIADPDAWFTYYYWLDDARAPDFARQVEIHRKPGYDPAELLYDETVPAVKLRAVGSVLRKKAGFRYRIRTVPLDPSGVSGSHGRLPSDPDHAPVLLCSAPELKQDAYAATDAKALLLQLADVRPLPLTSSVPPLFP